MMDRKRGNVRDRDALTVSLLRSLSGIIANAEIFHDKHVLLCRLICVTLAILELVCLMQSALSTKWSKLNWAQVLFSKYIAMSYIDIRLWRLPRSA